MNAKHSAAVGASQKAPFGLTSRLGHVPACGCRGFRRALLSSHTQMSSATPRRSMLKRCSCCAAVLDALILHATGRHLQSPPPRVECRRKCKRQKMHCTKQWAHGRYRSCRCYIMQAHRKLGANLPAPMKSSDAQRKGAFGAEGVSNVDGGTSDGGTGASISGPVHQHASRVSLISTNPWCHIASSPSIRQSSLARPVCIHTVQTI